MSDACWISLDEAARRLGTTGLNLLMRIKRGLLEGREQDGAWQVRADSLERAMSEGQKGPELKGCGGGHCDGGGCQGSR